MQLRIQKITHPNPSPWLVSWVMLKNINCPTIYIIEDIDTCLSPEQYCKVKWKELRSELELSCPFPFPITITVMLSTPPLQKSFATCRIRDKVNSKRRSQTVRRARHAGHCWRSRDELISDVLLWTPTHGRAKAGRPARTYIQQLCEDTGCCPEDLPRAMNDREE